jgi:hypothetical protein
LIRRGEHYGDESEGENAHGLKKICGRHYQRRANLASQKTVVVQFAFKKMKCFGCGAVRIFTAHLPVIRAKTLFALFLVLP